jgi:predicted naringenin-chalcone synthase
VLTQEEAADIAVPLCCENARQEQVLRTLYRKSGIDRRHVVARGEFYPPNPPTTAERMARFRDEANRLALNAATRAIEQSGIAPGDITHLVTVSCTGFSAPGVDLSLMETLPLSMDTQRLNVGFMGCHGAINGIRAVHGLTSLDANAVVLMCCVELCSLHFQYGWNTRQLTANALFADGAAAIVAAGSARPASRRIVSTASRVFPDTGDDMTWDIGDHGFEMTLSSRVPGKIAAAVREWLTEWLKPHALSLGDIGSWAIHPGGPRVLDGVQEALQLSDAAVAPSRRILRNYGNMSSGTVLFVLNELLAAGSSGPTILIAFGPGLTGEAALLY